MKLLQTMNYLARSSIESVSVSFSPSPTYFEVRLAALMLKKVALDSLATAFASIGFPLPRGPNNSRPRAGARRPVYS